MGLRLLIKKKAAGYALWMLAAIIAGLIVWVFAGLFGRQGSLWP